MGENKAKIRLMPSASHLRAQIEASLAERIPSALSPQTRVARSFEPTGIAEIDLLLHGGFPVGAVSEITGPECSGRTSLALGFIAGLTQAGKVCAWVDVSDTMDPESAAAIGVDLSRLLWIRCGVPAPVIASHAEHSFPVAEQQRKAKPGLPQCGGGHPRMEVRGLSDAVSDLLSTAPRCAEPLHKPRPEPLVHEPLNAPQAVAKKPAARTKLWSRLEQALRATDLLMQAGGFRAIVLDMGSLGAEYALRVPLATWFRFRSAAERLQSHVILLTQQPCARSSAGVVLRLEPGGWSSAEETVFTGVEHRAELLRQRFDNVLPLRKPPQSVRWESKATWAGRQ
jgi:recombination protein RecA